MHIRQDASLLAHIEAVAVGIVTTGSNWKFLTLEDAHMLIDYDEYGIDQAGKSLAIILQALIPEPQVPTRQ